ncbi:DUF2339 domain-containing protein [Chryseobacterium gambrini]|uniref:DUF2339 domain-containing protein n=1 Tax=Chryseobacterium gambrini TaxID=373672 RepID=A0AAJ1R2Z6_9FLAO|nr:MULTISPECIES: DUF2339 domain-containing protein [Chryseobacterium]MDN4012960.1 DUF2339 domain-containing protein [Chryseobacterium gambrini]QWA38631.1 DUF2339 domain-containing protein [Chryseobacterium sp. ZHDP1]
MIYAIVIFLILFIFIIYNNLSSKISKLEQKVSELSSKLNSEIPERKEEEKEWQKIPHPTEHEVLPQEEKNIQQEIIPEKEGKDWMNIIFEFLKQNALTIIGIFTLVLGIGYFVKYAIDKNWIGETPRVGIGFFLGAVIILLGHFLRKNYSVFSSIITGGGIAVLYFTVTIAFREYHLFSQNIAFSVTCLITLICIALSYYYKSEILIIFSLFGGFLAPLMVSSGHSNYLFLFTYITVLNLGMLAIAFLKNWKSIGWIAFIFTYVYLLYWTFETTQLTSIYFYISGYIIFYSFALKNYFRKEAMSSPDILMLVLINFTNIIGLVYIFNQLGYEPVIIFPLIFALVNSFLLFREYSQKNFGINYSVFAAVTVSLLTLAVALQFKTHLITSVWAIEATLLLYIWKKTGLPIFRKCFYILFPLVIAAQVITWTEYIDAKNLNIVFNPVFLTSLVTLITTFFNLFLLKKHPDHDEKFNTFLEYLFSILSYGVIYFAILLEIMYHISSQPWIVIFSVGIIFTLYYIFAILLFRKKLDIPQASATQFIYLFCVLIIIDTAVSGTGIVSNYLLGKISLGFYGLYLLYWIPFIYTILQILPKSNFFKIKLSYWLISVTIITALSFELYNIYILLNAENISGMKVLSKHFGLLYLSMIWAVLSSVLIYKGLKNNIPEYSKIGFALIAVTILKLYLYDVWEMDNISRIIAFIILGIILLLSSFLFQRLKKIIKNLVENKEEKPETENL